jgi:PAT family beta-lactamase induction signal transducer AmpG
VGSSLRGSVLRLGLLGSLYFSQGLPFGFFTQSVPVMLRNAGHSLGEVGLVSLLALPWALKFLWAPVVDRYGLSGYGHRKSWIIPLQLLAIVVMLTLAVLADTVSMRGLLIAVFLLNLVAATQDIATDGMAVDMLPPRERGWGNALQVAGYRVGMIFGGGALLIFHEQLGLPLTFAIMAAVTGLATIPVLLAVEPARLPAVSGSDASNVHFLFRRGTWQILALVALYKAGDAFAGAMLRPYLVDADWTLSDIGLALGTLGFGAGMLGAVLGGSLLNRIGRRRALLVFGIMQAATVAGYALHAGMHGGDTALYALVAAEHLAGGMATAALFTCMMDWCSEESSATDYTVQASTVVIATGVASALAGFSAQAIGYFGHFVVSAILAAGAVAAVILLFPRTVQTGRSSGAPVEVA